MEEEISEVLQDLVNGAVHSYMSGKGFEETEEALSDVTVSVNVSPKPNVSPAVVVINGVTQQSATFPVKTPGQTALEELTETYLQWEKAGWQNTVTHLNQPQVKQIVEEYTRLKRTLQTGYELDRKILKQNAEDIAKNCDPNNLEQNAFEAWALHSMGYDMEQHPLHYLFMNPKTAAAREGWNAAITYIGRRIKDEL